LSAIHIFFVSKNITFDYEFIEMIDINFGNMKLNIAYVLYDGIIAPTVSIKIPHMHGLAKSNNRKFEKLEHH
jgi:hypothetical protein